MAAQAGSAFIAVRPDLRGFHTQVRRELRTVNAAMRGIGREWGTNIRAGIKEKLKPIEVRLDAGRVARQVTTLNRALDKLDGRTARVDIDVQVGGALAELAVLDRVLDRLDRRRVNIDVGGVGGLNQVTGAAGAAAGGLRGMSAASTALSASLALAAGPQIVAVGAGIIGLLGPLTAAAVGFGGLAAVAIPSITRITEGAKNLTAAEQRLKTGLDSTKKAFTEWQRALQPAVLPVFTKALGLVPPLLKALTPITLSAARAVGDLVDRLRAGLQSPFFQQFARDLAGWVRPAISGLGTLVGNLLKAFAGLAQAFAPIGFTFLDMLNRMTAAFARFTTGLTGSSGFQRFAQAMINILDGMARGWAQLGALVGPILRTLLTTLFRLGLALQAAFRPLAAGVLPLLNLLAGALSRIVAAAAPVLVTLGQIIGALGTALAPILSTVLDVIADTLVQVIGALGTALNQAAPSLNRIVVSIASLVPELAPLVRLWGQWLVTIIPVIPAVLSIAATIISYLLPAVRFVIRVLVRLWTTVGGFLLPVLAKMVAAVQWVAAVIGPVFHAVGAVAMWLWHNAIGPALRGIGAAAMWLWTSAIKPAFTFIASLARWLYTVVAVVVIAPLLLQFKLWAAVAKWLYRSVISPVFEAIGAVIRWVWQHIIRPVFNAVNSVIRNVLAPVFRWIYTSVIKPIWDRAGSAIRWVWENVIRRAFDGIKSALRKLSPAFSTAVDAIKRAWNKLKDAARKPVAFVVNTVFNNGIVKLWNTVADLVPGTRRLGEIHFARGGVVGAGQYGVLPGYAPGQDTMLAAVSPGEAWIRPDATRALGAGFIYGINRAAASGGSAGAARWLAEHGGMQFGLGGIVGGFLKSAKNLFTDGLVKTARRAVDPLVALAQRSIGGTAFGDLAMGVTRGLAGNILKALGPLESKIGGDGRKVVKVAEKYVGLSGNPNRFTRRMGMNGLPWCGMFVDGVFDEARAAKALRGVANPAAVWSYRALPSVSPANKRPGDLALYRGDAGHINIYTGRGLVTIGGNESNSVRRQSGYITSASSIRRPRFARGGIVPQILAQDLRENTRISTPLATQMLRAIAGQPRLYDQGGWLPPGVTTVLNATGRPEAVLTEAQLRAITAGTRGGDGSSTTYNVYPRTLDMTVRDLETLQRRQDARTRVGRPR